MADEENLIGRRASINWAFPDDPPDIVTGTITEHDWVPLMRYWESGEWRIQPAYRTITIEYGDQTVWGRAEWFTLVPE